MSIVLRHKSEILVVVVPKAEVKKFILIDMIGGTALYWALLIPLHSLLAATGGSMIGPYLIRRTLKFLRR